MDWVGIRLRYGVGRFIDSESNSVFNCVSLTFILFGCIKEMYVDVSVVRLCNFRYPLSLDK